MLVVFSTQESKPFDELGYGSSLEAGSLTGGTSGARHGSTGIDQAVEYQRAAHSVPPYMFHECVAV